MAMPQALRDARGYRSRYINALNAAIKAIAPIAGRGIRLRQTPQGLPPRGRGRAPLAVYATTGSGITPAWAGKRRGVGTGRSMGRDYPRVGGEEPLPTGLRLLVIGLPPRGRGRGDSRRMDQEVYGITPAWAGKRSERQQIGEQSGDYPRVGGEELTDGQGVAPRKGLPPRGRGRVILQSNAGRKRGITPAWAGKRLACWSGARRTWDYPRVGGEETDTKRKRS